MKDNIDFNFIDRFLYKMIIGLFLLLLLFLSNSLKIISLESFQSKLNQHFDVFKIIKVINGEKDVFFPLEDDSIEVIGKNYSNYQSIENGMRIYSSDSNVYSIKGGVVVSVKKKDNYIVTIKGLDNNEYIYENITDLNIRIYQYVKTGEVIGSSNSSFDLYVSSSGKFISLDDAFPI